MAGKKEEKKEGGMERRMEEGKEGLMQRRKEGRDIKKEGRREGSKQGRNGWKEVSFLFLSNVADESVVQSTCGGGTPLCYVAQEGKTYPADP
jgi:hypothetical protein